MKGIRTHLHEAVNAVAGSIGNILVGHSEELAAITTKDALLKFLEDVVRPEIDPRFGKDMDKLVAEVGRLSFYRGYRCVYNYLLAGDNLKVI